MEQETSGKYDSYVCWDMAVLVHDLEKTVQRLEELGLDKFFLPDAPEGAEGLFYKGEQIGDYKALVGRIGNMQIEIIQPPEDTNNPWREFLDKKGEGIHHVGFHVGDVDSEVERLNSLGAETPFIGKINGKIGAAYVDLKIANLVVELTSFNDVSG